MSRLDFERDDIVVMLRKLEAEGGMVYCIVAGMAADEIERLRAEVSGDTPSDVA